MFPIGTVHKDYLPELPGLGASGENGCDFSAFLRTALLKRQLSKNRKEVEPRVNSTWGIEGTTS